MEKTTLFERLGGTPGIITIVDYIVALHMEAGSGGKAQYTGRTMGDAHRGMNINEAEYMAALDDILAALHKHAIDEQTKTDVLAIAYSLKGQILHA